MIKGLDELSRRIKELERAVSALDGEISVVSFDPNDPQSIEVAIQKMETAIDDRIGGAGNNDIVQGIATQMKERYRQVIFKRASEARHEQEDGA